MIDRRSFLRAAPALALVSAACEPGRRQVAGGGPDEGGIGGTGIFGVIMEDELAARGLLVNGLNVATDATTRYEALAGLGGPQLGDTVAIHAVRVAGQLQAARIAVFYPLIGPLSLSGHAGPTVLGTPIAVSAGTVVRDHRGQPLPQQDLRDGVRVAVSGLWRNEAVEASSLTILPPGDQVGLRGLLQRRDGRAVVGATTIPAAESGQPRSADGFVAVAGHLAAGRFVVDSITPDSVPLLTPPVGLLAVEGFVLPNRDAPGFHLGGFGVPLAQGATAPVGQRALLLGRYRDAFAVEAAIALPASARERTAVLAAPATVAALRKWRSG